MTSSAFWFFESQVPNDGYTKNAFNKTIYNFIILTLYFCKTVCKTLTVIWQYNMEKFKAGNETTVKSRHAS